MFDVSIIRKVRTARVCDIVKVVAVTEGVREAVKSLGKWRNGQKKVT